jgi:hypothetical protein
MSSILGDITRMKHKEVIPIVGKVITNLETAPPVAEPWGPNVTPLATLKSTYLHYRGSAEEADNGNRLMKKTRDDARPILNKQYTSVAEFFEIYTGHDVVVLTQIGFVVKMPKTTTQRQQVMMLNIADLSHGNGHGEYRMYVPKIKGAGAIEIDWCEGDPTVEESWKRYGTVLSGKNILLSGFTPGKIYTFRVRGVFAKGYGPWSAYKSLMSI